MKVRGQPWPNLDLPNRVVHRFQLTMPILKFGLQKVAFGIVRCQKRRDCLANLFPLCASIFKPGHFIRSASVFGHGGNFAERACGHARPLKNRKQLIEHQHFRLACRQRYDQKICVTEIMSAGNMTFTNAIWNSDDYPGKHG
jgi:hypothetical protein